VTVVDNQNPQISCPANITVNADPGQCNVLINVPSPVVNDNCGVSSILNSKNNTNNASDMYPVGVTSITWTVTDIHGRTSSCTMTITVTDNQNPTIVCPPDITVSSDPGLCSASGISLGSPLTSDNCGIQTVAGNAPVIFNPGLTLVTWTVTDIHGNISTCIQRVTVLDNQAPVITCPANITVNTSPGSCQANGVILGTPIISDNCPGTLVTNNAPASFNIGLNTIIWTATDAAGNTASCSQSVLVVDNQPPVITCSANLTMNASPGLCGINNVTLVPPTVLDNCTGIVSLTNNAPVYYPVGQTNVTWTATDASGNQATCTQHNMFVDNQPPTIPCPANSTVNNTPGMCAAQNISIGNPVTGDNCGVVSVNNNAPLLFPVGTTTVIWTVADAKGNTASCAQTVTVIDIEAPAINCPPDLTLSNTPGICGAINVITGTPSGNDNCGLASVTNNGPALYPTGTTQVIWTATDIYGHTSSCTQLITVIDTEPPHFGPLTDLTITANQGCFATGLSLLTPDVSDNCQLSLVNHDGSGIYEVGTTIVTWTATDVNGNVATTIQLITVVDTTSPVISCPQS